MTADHTFITQLIQQLDLQPHPEGGFYRQTYRSEECITRSGTDGSHTERRASTGIYYLLHEKAYSAWHRIDSDEMWHFYAGDPLLIHMLDEHGAYSVQRLGDALQEPDALFQYVVPARCWFAAERDGLQGFSLVGCTVAPGFEFDAFELADAASLLQRYPQHAEPIRRLASSASRD